MVREIPTQYTTYKKSNEMNQTTNLAKYIKSKYLRNAGNQRN